MLDQLLTGWSRDDGPVVDRMELVGALVQTQMICKYALPSSRVIGIKPGLARRHDASNSLKLGSMRLRVVLVRQSWRVVLARQSCRQPEVSKQRALRSLICATEQVLELGH